MYEFGYVEKNYQKAIQYFSIAESRGDINSSHHLATLYQQAECKNYHKAFRHAQTSAGYHNPEGEFILANLLYFGRGCQADAEKAYEMYLRAYMHGMDQAKFMMERIENCR
ncbi:MAG: sel1 repeat family protein, partial [Clostridia bacterium]|nr:sel1 repeat family protein [Clostridia bacterium]